jgi:hypothetical protein
VEVVLLGMLELELMSVLVPGVEEVLPAAVPEALMSLLVPGVVVLPAPIDVPLPVVPEVAPAVVSVLLPGVVEPSEPEPLAVLLVSLGDVVVEGAVLEVDDDVAASSFLPQAVRDKAAIRARAAHCAIGDLIIRKLLEGVCRYESREVLTAFPLPAAHFSAGENP